MPRGIDWRSGDFDSATDAETALQAVEHASARRVGRRLTSRGQTTVDLTEAARDNMADENRRECGDGSGRQTRASKRLTCS